MNPKKIIIAFLSALLCGCFAYAGEAATNNFDEDKEKRLEEIIVDEARRRSEKLPTTGRVNIQPIPVAFSRFHNNRFLFTHNAIEIILRPVRKADNDLYEFDRGTGQPFKAVLVTLNPDGNISGSRIKRPDVGERTFTLPEAIYAITEVRYLVSNKIRLPDDPPHYDFRFCLADRTIAFDVKAGQTTDLGRLVIRGLETRFKKEDTEHRPILGADAPFVDISNPGFRNKAPEKAAAGIISFTPEGALCREKSKKVPGWFTPDEMKDALPDLYARTVSVSQ